MMKSDRLSACCCAAPGCGLFRHLFPALPEAWARWLAGVAFATMAFPAWAILPIQQWQTKSGARVYFVENHDLPIVDTSVDFPAGSAFDTPEKSGVANTAHRMMQLGVEGLNEDEIAGKLADTGAQLSESFDNDRAGYALRTLSSREEREQALQVFARVLQTPVFPENVLEREKARLIAALKEADTRPETIASRTFYRRLYGNHPYALRPSGEPATIEKIARADLIDFYREHYTAEEAVISLIGDVGREEAAAIAERLADRLPRRGVGAAALPAVAPLASSETQIIPHPASQSHILIGAPGIRRDDPDYFPLIVGNYVLGGGGFASRIIDEVRQKRGLAYSAYSYFSPQLRRGPFVIGMQTKREQTQQALDVVRRTLRGFVAEGPTEAELKAAKENIIGSFPLRIDSNRKILGYLAVIGFYRLPLSYLDDFVHNVEQVSAAQVKEAFARHVHPDRMVTVVVGGDESRNTAAQAAQ